MPGTEEQQKTAGALVYLIEELGDARMRCDQLLRYVERGTKLIEKSAQKEHLFEVAGDMIRGIPETSFKLHKALQAVALAANRIDYEEIKQDLRPNKVEELERVLKDVRIRQVQRRSLPTMLNPESVVTQLRSLAKQARVTGRLATADLASLIQALETESPRTAVSAGAKAAEQLDAMARALENPPEGEAPSRVRLAQILRRTYAEHMDLVDVGTSRVAAKIPESAAEELLAVIAMLKKVASGAGDPKRRMIGILSGLAIAVKKMGQDEMISNLLDRAASAVQAKWSSGDLKDVEKSEKTASLDAEERLSRFEEGKSADPTKKMSPEDAKEWKENTEEHKDKFKKEAGKIPESASEELLAVIVMLKKVAAGAGDPKRRMIGILSGLAIAVKKMGQDEMISNLIERAASAVKAKWSSSDLEESEESEESTTTEKTASKDDRRSRYEEGKSADPTENMSEPDAKEWKENTEEHKDDFKAATRAAAIDYESWKVA